MSLLTSVPILVWFIVVGLVAGWFAARFMKGGPFSRLGDLVVGCVGAVLGGLLFGQFRIHISGRYGHLWGSLAAAAASAILLLFILRRLKRSGKFF